MTWTLLGAGVAVQLVGVLSATLLRGPLERVHATSTAMPAAVLVAAAVWVAEGPSLIALKALLLASAVALTSPVLSQVTARAIVAARGREDSE